MVAVFKVVLRALEVDIIIPKVLDGGNRSQFDKRIEICLIFTRLSGRCGVGDIGWVGKECIDIELLGILDICERRFEGLFFVHPKGKG